MKTEELAVVVYGVLTILLAAGLAVFAGSRWGLVLAVMSSGVAYLFQCVQLYSRGTDDEVGPLLLILWFVAVFAPMASVAASIWG